MPFEFDPKKAASNLAKHGVDFASVEFFVWEEGLFLASLGRGEPRIAALAPIGDRLHMLVFAIEHRAVRIISLRKASRKEIKLWQDAI